MTGRQDGQARPSVFFWRCGFGAASLVAAALSGAAGCGGSSPPAPTPTPSPVFSASTSDPTGDASPDARVGTSPDLVSAFIEVKDGTVRFRLQFASGSYDRATTGVHVLLDLDQNVATGLPGTGRGEDVQAIGADGVIALNIFQPVFFVSRCSTTQETNWRPGSPPCTPSGPISLTQSGDTTEGSFSLSLLGDDGRMNVKVVAWVIFDQVSSDTVDSMTDVGQGAFVVR